MTDQDFIERGYKEFRPTSLDSPYVEKCFQKRFDDDRGKKYFITVKKWEGWTHPHTGDKSPPGYEYDIQMYKKGDHDAIDILFHSTWSIEAVEDYMEKLWNTGLFDYYELWDGTREGQKLDGAV